MKLRHRIMHALFAAQYVEIRGPERNAPIAPGVYRAHRVQGDWCIAHEDEYGNQMTRLRPGGETPWRWVRWRALTDGVRV